jgi:hypothetical protein
MDRLSRALERLGEVTGEPATDKGEGTGDAVVTPAPTAATP